MPPAQLFTLTLLAMLAFAANTVLCRLALRETAIDAASFTAIRLVSGALTLWLIVHFRSANIRGNWTSALALFAYAAPFSFAYITLETGVGALLLFGAVQATMILTGFARGERLAPRQSAGLALSLGGLIYLLLPGVAAPFDPSAALRPGFAQDSPPLAGSLLMLTAGIAWGVYSLLGRSAADPLADTAGNFVRAAPLGIALSAAALPWVQFDSAGAIYAILSGALASGVGYAIWYAALPGLSATRAAVVQLSVPIIAALAGVVLVSEPITFRLIIASAAILGGIALVVVKR